MADFQKNQSPEDVEAAEAQVKADAAAAEEKARVEAEEKAKADAAAAEAAKQTDPSEDEEPVATVAFVLDPEYAAEYDTDRAIVGTPYGEYVLSATPTDVPQTDAENVLASPAAKEQE